MLEVKGLRVGFGGSVVLKGISLTVAEGELVALIGANGAGKTTTLRTISGLVKPGAGSITVNGAEVAGLAPEAIVRMGVVQVPQGGQVFPRMTVQENLEMGAFLRTDRAAVTQDTRKVFELFSILAARRRQKAGSLSGGEKQMLAIGRALMARPRILLLDEPAIGLAPRLVEEMARIIADINSRGAAVLLVEQNVSMALQIATRAYVMETGTIVREGGAAELASDSAVQHSYMGVA